MTEERNPAIKKLIIAGVLALAVIAIAIVYLMHASKPEVKLDKALRRYDRSDRVTMGMEAVLDADPDLGETAQALIDENMQKNAPKPYILELALIANGLVDHGLDADYAADICVQALHTTDYTDTSYSWDESLEALLKVAPEDAILGTLEKVYEGSNRLYWYQMDWFADIDRELSAGLMLDMMDSFIRMEADEDDVAEFSARIPAATIDEATALIAESDESRRAGRAAILGRRYTKDTDVLAFLRECIALGLKPSEVYPDGAVLDADLSMATNDMFSADFPLENTLLVISRTEKPEPTEYVSLMDHQTTSGKFTGDYDGNDKSSPDNYTVRLETALMDDIPPENLPASLEECSYIILLDSLYQLEGTLTKTLSYSSISKSVTEYPVYCCQQTAWLCAGENWDYLFLHDYQIVNAPEPPKSMATYANIDAYLLAEPDMDWARSAAVEMLNDLSEADWNVLLYMLSE